MEAAFSCSPLKILMFDNQNNGTRKLRDNRAFAGENTDTSRDEDENKGKLGNLSIITILLEIGCEFKNIFFAPRRDHLQ